MYPIVHFVQSHLFFPRFRSEYKCAFCVHYQ